MIRFLFYLSLGIILQPCLGQHVHKQHPVGLHYSHATPHVRNFIRDFDREEALENADVEVTVDEWRTIISVSRSNKTCTDKSLTVSHTWQKTHSVKIGIGWKFSAAGEWAAGALFSKVKVAVSAEVSPNAEMQDTKTITFNTADSTTLGPCSSENLLIVQRYKEATTTLKTWDHEISCVDGSTAAATLTYCNALSVTGSGHSWTEEEGAWSTLPAPSDCDDCEPTPEPISGLGF